MGENEHKYELWIQAVDGSGVFVKADEIPEFVETTGDTEESSMICVLPDEITVTGTFKISEQTKRYLFGRLFYPHNYRRRMLKRAMALTGRAE